MVFVRPDVVSRQLWIGDLTGLPCTWQVTGHAQKKAGSVQDQAADTVEGVKATASDALNKGQAHGESAWQKAKDVVTNAYEQVMTLTVRVCHDPDFVS